MKKIAKWLNEYENAFDDLKNSRSVVESEISSVLSEMGINNVIISSRIKDLKRLEEKIHRNRYFTKYGDDENIFNFLKDSIGVRVICLEYKDEKKVYEKIFEAYKQNKFSKVSYDDTIENQPEDQKNGHDIYRINGKVNEYFFELQIKSTTHMLWGEIEHLLFYKNYNCIIGERYLKQQIEQLHSDIMSIDSRLSDLKQYVIKDSEVKEFQEVKDITRSMLYTMFHSKFKSYSNEIEMDMRDMYRAITDYYYKDSNYILKENKSHVSSAQKKESLYSKFSTFSKQIDSNYDETIDWTSFFDEDYKIPDPLLDKIIKIILKFEDIEKKDKHWSYFFNILFTVYSPILIKGELVEKIAKYFYATYTISDNLQSYDIPTSEYDDAVKLNECLEEFIFDYIFYEMENTRTFNMMNTEFNLRFNDLIEPLVENIIQNTDLTHENFHKKTKIVKQYLDNIVRIINEDKILFSDAKKTLVLFNVELELDLQISKFDSSKELSGEEFKDLFY